MAQTLKIAKNNPQAGRVKGKALFESIQRDSMLDKEVTILAPGEKATIAPGHKLWVCVDSLSRQYGYHTRSKATLTGPLVYTTAPSDTMSICQRIETSLDETVMVGVIAGFFAVMAFIAIFIAADSGGSLFALAMSILLGVSSFFAFQHAARYKRVDDTIYNTDAVIAELEKVGFSTPTNTNRIDEPVDDEVPSPSGDVAVQLRKS